MCLLELLGLQTTQHCLIQSSACLAIFYFSGNVSHRFGIGKFLYKTNGLFLDYALSGPLEEIAFYIEGRFLVWSTGYVL
jgi:hypothetical protein